MKKILCIFVFLLVFITAESVNASSASHFDSYLNGEIINTRTEDYYEVKIPVKIIAIYGSLGFDGTCSTCAGLIKGLNEQITITIDNLKSDYISSVDINILDDEVNMYHTFTDALTDEILKMEIVVAEYEIVLRSDEEIDGVTYYYNDGNYIINNNVVSNEQIIDELSTNDENVVANENHKSLFDNRIYDVSILVIALLECIFIVYLMVKKESN